MNTIKKLCAWLYTDSHESVMNWRFDLNIIGSIVLIPIGLSVATVYRFVCFIFRTIVFIFWVIFTILYGLIMGAFSKKGVSMKNLIGVVADAVDFWLFDMEL